MQRYAHSRAIAYADDGYMNASLSVALHILADLQQGFKADAGLELNVLETQILVKGVSSADAAAKGFLANVAHLTPLKDMITQVSFAAEGYVA